MGTSNSWAEADFKNFFLVFQPQMFLNLEALNKKILHKHSRGRVGSIGHIPSTFDTIFSITIIFVK